MEINEHFETVCDVAWKQRGDVLQLPHIIKSAYSLINRDGKKKCKFHFLKKRLNPISE